MIVWRDKVWNRRRNVDTDSADVTSFGRSFPICKLTSEKFGCRQLTAWQKALLNSCQLGVQKNWCMCIGCCRNLLSGCTPTTTSTRPNKSSATRPNSTTSQCPTTFWPGSRPSWTRPLEEREVTQRRWTRTEKLKTRRTERTCLLSSAT